MGGMFSLIFALAILVAFVGVFVWVSRRIRKGGGGTTAGVLGAIHEMLSRDQRKAAETIVQRNAGKSEEDESSSEPGRQPDARSQ